ncbi:hypothetical protein LOAG_03718 [Loa loa]|uniref:PLC-beta PH domain-containing protein n=1 Tax=Loa loa TaxID=7209 RepID=A0A1S0U421_LOALO|nr:hypothetical protein LOAG_03718 [Loa loa]EFO24766.1 hypothetical protein LOAG_03718 [Loa loa]
MSIHRLLSTKNHQVLIDDYFTTGEQITDQFEGRFVHLSLSRDGLLLFWKQYKGNEVIASEFCYIDDLIDVFSGCCAENSRRQGIHQKANAECDADIQIFRAIFTVLLKKYFAYKTKKRTLKH